MMTFRERFLMGETEFDEIFDLTDEWNASDDTRTLREFLGLTEEEEDVWISESDEALEELLEKEKQRHIFFTDLDDTLLTRDKQISPKTEQELQRILKEGHVVVLSTGRAAASALKQAERLSLERPGCYISCYNGGQLIDLSDGRTLKQYIFDKDVIASVSRLAEEMHIHLQAYDDTSVVVTADNDEVRRYVSLQNLPYRVVNSLSEALPQGTPKFLAIHSTDHEQLDRFRQALSENFGDILDAFFSNAFYLEIVPKGVSKGAMLHSLCELLTVPVAHTIAAGDQENDISMVVEAGVGCAMANAVDTLKEKADYITTADCDHDGVAEILAKFIP